MTDPSTPAGPTSTERVAPAGRARAACRERFGEPRLVASAPGRVNLVGGHTDYNEGFVLPVAVDRRTAVAVHPRGDDTVRVHSLAFDETATVAIADPTSGEPRWADYVRGVVHVLTADGYAVPGADLVVASDVPVGGGLASSAALEVATAYALVATAGGDPTAARTDIAAACRRAETDVVGVPCGPMDQIAATRGERDRALLLDCRSGETDPLALGPEIAVLVVDTNVSHELVDSAYADRRRACERGVALLSSRLEGVDALRDVSIEAFERHADALPSPVRSRCRHVVRENARVLAAAEALRAGDLGGLGERMVTSHASLRDDYEVSCAELDHLVELLDRPDVFGARMTGAGFGGCVVALTAADAVGTVADAVAGAYASETGVDPDVHVCRAAEGARLETD